MRIMGSMRPNGRAEVREISFKWTDAHVPLQLTRSYSSPIIQRDLMYNEVPSSRVGYEASKIALDSAARLANHHQVSRPY
jgi:hypothetical protein